MNKLFKEDTLIVHIPVQGDIPKLKDDLNAIVQGTSK